MLLKLILALLLRLARKGISLCLNLSVKMRLGFP